MFQKDLSARLTLLKHHNKLFIVCGDFNTALNNERDGINIHIRDRECDSTSYIEYKDWYKMLISQLKEFFPLKLINSPENLFTPFISVTKLVSQSIIESYSL